MASIVPWNDARSLLIAANLVPLDHIQWPNEPYEQPDNAIWLSVEAYSDLISPIDIGAHAYGERGRLMIYCIANFGSGSTDLRIMAKAVVDTYRNLGPRNPSYSDCSIGVGSPSEAGDVYILPVSIEFFYSDLSV